VKLRLVVSASTIGTSAFSPGACMCVAFSVVTALVHVNHAHVIVIIRLFHIVPETPTKITILCETLSILVCRSKDYSMCDKFALWIRL